MSLARSARLVVGLTRSGKTSLSATFAEWIAQRFGKRTRLVTADGGSWGDKMEDLIKLGFVEPWLLRTRVGAGGEGLVEETCARAAQGFWPKEFLRKETGEVLPGVELLPPITVSYRFSCAAGHLVAEVATQKQLTPRQCPQCKVAVTLQTGKVEKLSGLAPHVNGVGAYILEGLTSWSNWHLAALADRRAGLQLHGEKSNIGRFISGDMVFDGNNRADYGFVQNQAEKWLLWSTTIPGLEEAPLWTALETRVEESGTALPFWAPAIAGQARSGQVPQWVGDCLGATVVFDEKGRKEHRLYLTEYRDQDGTPHKVGSRAEPGTLPEYLADGEGTKFSSFNIGVYLDMLIRAREASLAATRERLKGVEMPPPPAQPVVVAQPMAPSAAPSAVKPILPRANPLGVPSRPLGPPRPPTLVGKVGEKKA